MKNEPDFLSVLVLGEVRKGIDFLSRKDPGALVCVFATPSGSDPQRPLRKMTVRGCREIISTPEWQKFPRRRCRPGKRRCLPPGDWLRLGGNWRW